LRGAARRPAPGAPLVAHVLRAVHRGRLVLLDSRAGGKGASAAVHDRADARAADSAAVRRDVLLAVAGAPVTGIAATARSRASRSGRRREIDAAPPDRKCARRRVTPTRPTAANRVSPAR